MIVIQVKNRLIKPDYIDIQASTYLANEMRCAEDGEYDLRFLVNQKQLYSITYPNKHEALNILNKIKYCIEQGIKIIEL